MVAPIISGAMAAHVGWRNFWWLNVALTGLSFLMVAFMFPETKWHRLHPDEIDQSSLASSTKQDVSSLEKAPVDASTEHVVTATSKKPEDPLEATDTASRDPWLGRGGPSKQQWAIFQPNVHPWKSIALDLWIPWKLFAFPIVEFASFVVSWSCSSFLTLNLTQTQAFAAPPYNFSSQSIGKYFKRLLCRCISAKIHHLRLHKLCHSRRCFYWTCNCRATERLGICSRNKEKQWRA
jgi:MFS family permease